MGYLLLDRPFQHFGARSFGNSFQFYKLGGAGIFIDAQIGNGDLLDFFLFCLHNVREFGGTGVH